MPSRLWYNYISKIFERGDFVQKILILFFSGAGATKRVAELMLQRLSQNYSVEMFSVESSDIPPIENYDALIIGTPTYHATPARAIMKYFDALPCLNKKIPTFIFNTRGAASLNTNRILSIKLNTKNIVTIMDRQYRSPGSDGALIAPFIKRFFEFEKNLEDKIARDCICFADLLSKVEFQEYIPKFNLWCIINAPNKLAGHVFTLRIRLHKNKCVKCCRCIDKCPHLAFSTDKDGYPSYSPKNCENCYRCIHHCPHTALSLCKRKTPKKLLRY